MASKNNRDPGPTFEKLRRGYADKLPGKVEVLLEAIVEAATAPTDSPKVDHARALAHQLAGTAGTYGFTNLAELAFSCESALSAYQSEGDSTSSWKYLVAGLSLARDLSLDQMMQVHTEPAQEDARHTKGNIIVIDDDEDFLAIIAKILLDAQYNPLTMLDASGLDNLVGSFYPDLILLDIEMPEVDGFSVCQDLRKNDYYENIPIVFLTSHNSPEDRIAAFRAGGDDFINKPIVAEELLTRVNLRIEKAQYTREKQLLLRRAERHRDSLLSLLDQLQLGTLMLSPTGEVGFINRYCTSIGLEPGTGINKRWEDVLPLDDGGKRRFQADLEAPATERSKLTFSWMKGGQRIFVTCEIRDIPGEEGQQIVCLNDVSELHRLRRAIEENTYGRMIGSSAPMRKLFRLIGEVARGDWTVLIEGETGCGKDLVAHSIHDASPRRDGPFIAVNAAGLSESLLASQLFGHRKGAFTGAVSDQAGYFESAEGGTLFLDEIGDLPLSMQSSLLRVLQEKEITRVGETRVRQVDVRVLAATHKDLTAEIGAGRFREDLLFRLRVARLSVPSLRERKADIPLLVEAFIAESTPAAEKARLNLNPEAMRALMEYNWPGNVRELKAAIDFTLIHSQGEDVEREDLPPEIRQIPAASPVFGVNHTSEPIPTELDESSRILAALEQTAGNRAKAAKLLGVSRATFYRRLDKLGISPEK